MPADALDSLQGCFLCFPPAHPPVLMPCEGLAEELMLSITIHQSGIMPLAESTALFENLWALQKCYGLICEGTVTLCRPILPLADFAILSGPCLLLLQIFPKSVADTIDPPQCWCEICRSAATRGMRAKAQEPFRHAQSQGKTA